jgi:hypothetical protein
VYVWEDDQGSNDHFAPEEYEDYIEFQVGELIEHALAHTWTMADWNSVLMIGGTFAYAITQWSSGDDFVGLAYFPAGQVSGTSSEFVTLMRYNAQGEVVWDGVARFQLR